ncbi:zinc transport system permease protein [Orenia metallireducens]|jgi:zinc transport system permease protein|uniref:Zinc transport system permease protein n=1 Tax=Orenia metallireducens TaxID=1413210 RepID=A0A285HUQ1_9FIRM|nr:metal ABC transporter permease [Orenia metallireducens]PRX30994.1 zinc transport system permease protein [Orenia metallireducens]SNY39440.1 zinc transport system permease protein [Orenia metallireducens]
MLLDIFTYSFMQRAFIVGNVIAVICPLIGVFLVLKRLSLIGNTLSHVALTGVAIGMIFGIYPIYTALAVSVLAAVGIEKLRKNYKDYAELSLSIILATGLGLATILISLSNNNSGIFSYLFGSISMVTRQDVLTVIPLAVVIIGVILYFYYGFFFLAFNESDAKLAGIPVKILNLLFMILVSITVSLSMRIIGGLLVSSLITLPVAGSLQMAKSFKQTIIYSIIFSVLAVNTGLFISFYYDLASGGTIIVASVIYLIAAIIYKKINSFLYKRSELKVAVKD